MRRFVFFLLFAATVYPLCGCDTKNLGVPLNNRPVITAATYVEATATLTVSAQDADGDDLAVSVSLPAGFAVDDASKAIAGGNGSAAFVWSALNAALGATGTATVSVSDGRIVTPVTQSVQLVISAGGPGANHAPVITSAVYDVATKTLTVAATDVDSDNLTATVTVPTGLAVDTASRTIAGGSGTAVFTWSALDAAAGATGDTTISVTDNKVAAPVTQAVTITIAAVGPGNHDPVIDSAVFDPATDALTVHVTDVDGDTVAVSVSVPTGLAVDQVTRNITGSGDAVFAWTATAPAAGGQGETTVSASDGSGTPPTEVVTITVDPVNEAPEITGTTAVDQADGTAVLTVSVTDAEGDDVTVGVSLPAGMTVDQNSAVVTGGNGDAVFTFTATDKSVETTGEVTVSANDGVNGPVTATQIVSIAASAVVIPPITLAADTLYAFPEQSAAAVGAPITIWVVSGTPAHALQFLTTVGFTCENDGAYMADSFNYGIPGGTRKAADGYWALMGPPAPSAFLDLGDDTVPGLVGGKDIGGGLWRYNFAIVPQGVFTPPATLDNGVAYLFTFQLTFSTPGVKHLGFQLNDGAFDQTYYSDGANVNYFWSVLATETLTIN